MCGRVYETYSDEELYFRYLSKRPVLPRLQHLSLPKTPSGLKIASVAGRCMPRQFDCPGG
jgi:hypothetical protein